MYEVKYMPKWLQDKLSKSLPWRAQDVRMYFKGSLKHKITKLWGMVQLGIRYNYYTKQQEQGAGKTWVIQMWVKEAY